GSDAGWVFVVDATTRQGVWWTWAGEPLTPLQGIPLDRPLVAQGQALLRQALRGSLGALLLLATGWVIGRLLAADQERGGFQASWNKFGDGAHLVIRRRAFPARLILVGLTLVSFGLALHVALNVLEGVPHVQDSVTYLFQAQTMAGGALAAPAPPLAEAGSTTHFAQEFLLVRDGRWFGKYPPGYPALLALGVRAGAPWLVNPLLAVLTIPLVYVLAQLAYTKNEGRRAAPFLAALLLAISPFFLLMSGSLMIHAAELFWTLLFMVAWVKGLARRQPANDKQQASVTRGLQAAGYRKSPAGGQSVASSRWVAPGSRPALAWSIVAGAALGMLFLTRQFTAATVGLSFGMGWYILTFRNNRATQQPLAGAYPPTTNGANAPSLPRSPAPLLFLATLLPFLLALPLYQAALTGDARTDPRLLYWPYDRVGFGPTVGEPENVFTLTVTEPPAVVWRMDSSQPPRGHTPSRGLYNLGRNLTALEDDLFGWPALLTLGFLWLALLLRRPAAGDWVLLLVALAVAGGYVAYWGAGIAYGPRYFYAALPALVILSARGISALAEVGGRRPAVFLLLALLAYNFFHLPGRFEAYRGYNFISAAPRAAVEAAVERPALVFVTASDVDWWEYGAFFSGNTPWLDGPVVYARDRGPAENARLQAYFPDRAAYLWRDGQLTAFSP
ncbi:hypothetical protein, partial [Promineifilum sp.]|uniref:hypothetical protein n=1 Tax=Promineifilum sp. TaxID=2664178 RepID=UPI0035AFED00